MRGPIIARRERDRLAAQAIARVGGRFAPSAVVADLSVSDQQLTAIAKALTTDARIIVMDEPSAHAHRSRPRRGVSRHP